MRRQEEVEGMSMCLKPVSLLVSLVNSATEFNDLASNWKLSNKDRNLGLLLAEQRMVAILEDTSINFFQDLLVDKIDQDWVLELVRYSNRTEYFSALSHWEVPVMPVSGHDLIAAGIRSGRRLGKVLVLLRKKWVKSRYEMGKEELLENLEGLGEGEEEEEVKGWGEDSKRRKVN